MSIDPTLLEDATAKLMTLGVCLAETIAERTRANADADLAEASKAFERVSRGTRKAILLARALDKPLRACRVTTRKRIIREVEDGIQRQAEDDDEAETLHFELLDRLDTLDREDDIDSLPVETIIRDILRDFGLAHIRGANHPWKRRTPDDIAELNARAAMPKRVTVPPGVCSTPLATTGNEPCADARCSPPAPPH